MCERAEHLIADKALAAAQAEWDLLETIQRESRFHREAVHLARRILERRGDTMALAALGWALGSEEASVPDAEAARALVETPAEEKTNV